MKNSSEIMLPPHRLFQFNTKNLENKQEKTICHCDNVIDVTREINPCLGGPDRISLLKMKQIADKYIKFKLCIPDTPTFDICIHIRDGDIFSNLIHFEYIQPCFDYYNQCLLNNRNKSICILYTTGNSPIIPKLKETIENLNMKNVIFQHGSLESDLITLCSCETLVWSFSSFCFIPFVFSKTIKNHIIPEYIFSRERGARGKPWAGLDYPLANNIQIIKHPNYILPGNWKNTPEQIETILNYKLPDEEKNKLL